MNVTLTNLLDVDLPISSTKGGNWADRLEPNVPYTFDVAKRTVVTVGDNPSFVEELKEAAKDLVELVSKLVTFWKDKQKAKGATEEAMARLRIENKGVNQLRVLLGDNTKEVLVPAGATYEAVAVDYVEIREQGV